DLVALIGSDLRLSIGHIGFGIGIGSTPDRDHADSSGMRAGNRFLCISRPVATYFVVPQSDAVTGVSYVDGAERIVGDGFDNERRQGMINWATLRAPVLSEANFANSPR